MGIDVMADKNRCTGTTTNDDNTEIDNCGADGCEVVEAEKKMTGFYFNKISIGCITKRNTCRAWRGRRSKSWFRKIEENVFPGFPLKAMSHADIIFCCAFTEI
jgi:hypothetical protein